MNRVGGIILCGGQSRRMGRPKACLPIGREVFLQRIVRVLHEVVSPVVVVSAPEQTLPDLPMGIRITHDARPDRGPLQGLLAGLDCIASDADAVYLSSCDVPLLRTSFVGRMVELLDGFDIVVPEIDGRPHPLAGVYRISVRESVRELLDADRLRPVFLFEHMRTRLVSAGELRDVDPSLASLRNVNTPEEYAALLRDDI